MTVANFNFLHWIAPSGVRSLMVYGHLTYMIPSSSINPSGLAAKKLYILSTNKPAGLIFKLIIFLKEILV